MDKVAELGKKVNEQRKRIVFLENECERFQKERDAALGIAKTALEHCDEYHRMFDEIEASCPTYTSYVGQQFDGNTCE